MNNRMIHDHAYAITLHVMSIVEPMLPDWKVSI